MERKYYIDNIRWLTIILVIIYHIIYVFNCSGVISNINVRGIPQLDAFLVFVYPWFMCLLFVVSGMSAKFSLQKRTPKQFLADRTKRLLIPSIMGIFAYSWIAGMITDKYVNIFAKNPVPPFVKYIIYCMMGIGPLWFAQMLFIAGLVLLIIKKIDKSDKLSELGSKCGVIILLVMTLPVFGSAQILYAKTISVYRFGIYIFMFLLGYYVFSQNEVIEKLKRFSVVLGILSIVCGVIYTFYYYGTNYADNACLTSFFTNAYLWIAILAILANASKYLNFNNAFSKYMTKNNFNFYVLHYSVVVLSGYLTVTYLNLPFALNYVVMLASVIIFLPFITEILKRIPILNTLLLGKK